MMMMMAHFVDQLKTWLKHLPLLKRKVLLEGSIWTEANLYSLSLRKMPSATTLSLPRFLLSERVLTYLDAHWLSNLLYLLVSEESQENGRDPSSSARGGGFTDGGHSFTGMPCSSKGVLCSPDLPFQLHQGSHFKIWPRYEWSTLQIWLVDLSQIGVGQRLLSPFLLEVWMSAEHSCSPQLHSLALWTNPKSWFLTSWVILLLPQSIWPPLWKP